MELPKAVEVFARAIGTIKSRYHPFLVNQIDGLWVLRDGPGRKEPRSGEVINAELSPADVVDKLKEINPGWHCLCDIRSPGSDLEAVKREYKRLGYRARSTEWMFSHDLETIPSFQSNPPAVFVQSAGQLAHIPQAASQGRKFYKDARLFGVWDGERDYGWVESVPVGKNAWVCGLYVYEPYRRHGYGSALMSALLAEDKRNGAKNCVLLASSSGAKLYPRVGYKLIGVLQSFSPIRRFSGT